VNTNLDQGRRDRLPWVALVIVAVVVIAVVIAYFVAQKTEEAHEQQQAARRAALAPEVGTACEALRIASRAFDNDDVDELRDSIKDAEESAVKALQTSGIKFGKPEEMALYLGAEPLGSPRSQERIDRRLDVARESCTRLES
jgi:hypothetical protein